MTTTLKDVDVALNDSVPVAPSRHDLAVDRLLLTSRALGRARRALDGERAGRELDNRMAAFQAAALENHKSITELLDAEAAAADARQRSA